MLGKEAVCTNFKIFARTKVDSDPRPPAQNASIELLDQPFPVYNIIA